MNNLARYYMLTRFPPRLMVRPSSTASKNSSTNSGETQTNNIASPNNFGKLQGLLSTMKKREGGKFYNELSKYGNSDMFNYATNEKYKREELKAQYLETWNKFLQYDVDNSPIKLPSNGFEEMILWTEQGKLWKYPIDNEQGLEAEKQVPFEEHVFLDQHLDSFPKNENVRKFMELVVAGLARNNWMTVDRKREVIRFYKEYFEEKRDIYKEAGIEL